MATNMKIFWDLLSWRRTTTIQKMIWVAAGLFTLSYISGYWTLFILYVITLPVTWKLTHKMLDRQTPVASDKILLTLQAINRVKKGIISLTHSQKDPHDRRPVRACAEDSIDDYDNLDIGRAKHVSTLKGPTFEGEVRIFVKYVVRDFVQSWYEDISSDTQTLIESQKVLLNVADNLTKRGRKIHPQRLTVNLIDLYTEHLHKLQLAKLFLQSQAKTGPQSKIESLEDAFAHKFKLHPSLTSKESEISFLRSLSKVMLTYILPPDMQNCRAPVVMITEVVAFNVLKSAVEKLTSIDWIHESMIALLADEVEDTIKGLHSKDGELLEKLSNCDYEDQTFDCIEDTCHKLDTDCISTNLLTIPTIRLESVDNVLCDVAKSDLGDGFLEDENECLDDEKCSSSHVSLIQNNCSENQSGCESCDNESKSKENEDCFPPETLPLSKDLVELGEDNSSPDSSESVQTSDMKAKHLALVTTQDSKSNESCNSGSNQISPVENPRRMSSTSSLFSLFTRRKKSSKSDSKSSRSDSATSDQYVRQPSDNTDDGEVFDSSLGVECSEEAAQATGDTLVHFFVDGDNSDAKSDTSKEDQTEIVFSDSSFFFQDISVPETEERTEYRSSSKYTLYTIEYNAMYFSDGPPVLKTGDVKRRFREFVNLQSRLEGNSAYKKLLKDVKGPSRWNTMPFKNMDKESIESRRLFLEKYCKALIRIEAICNGPELREFLAYEGDGHIAFVRKATEINVPRIDKMLVKTVSGVFDKLKSIPDIPQNVISAVTKRDRSVERQDAAKTTTDNDKLELDFGHRDVDVEPECIQWNQTVEDFISSSDKCEEEDSLPTASGLDKKEQDLLWEEIHAQLPRLQGDGSEAPPVSFSEGKGLSVHDLRLANSVLDLALHAVQQQDHWITRERVFVTTRILLGKALDRWLSDQITFLTSPNRWVYYSQLLRESVWPHGELSSEETAEKTPAEKTESRRKAKQCLKDFFPDVFEQLVGDEVYEDAAEWMMDSVKHEQLNKHFLFTFLEILVEKLFPEITAQELQEKLFA